jgi:hypothetical protein
MNALPFAQNLIIAAAAGLIGLTLSCGTSKSSATTVASVGADKVFRSYELRIEPGVSTAIVFLRREGPEGEPLELGNGASLTLNGKQLTREQRVYADTIAYADMNLASAEKFVFVLNDGKGGTFTDELDVMPPDAAIEPPDASGAIRIKLSRTVSSEESAEAAISVVKRDEASNESAGNIKVVDGLNDSRDAITIAKAELDKLGSGSAVIRVSLTSEKGFSSGGGGKAKIRIVSPPIDVKLGDTGK